MNRTVMIRLATPKDAAEMLKIYAHYVVNTAISFEYESTVGRRIQRKNRKHS
mgnify:CR=1 FL=1